MIMHLAIGLVTYNALVHLARRGEARSIQVAIDGGTTRCLVSFALLKIRDLVRDEDNYIGVTLLEERPMTSEWLTDKPVCSMT